MPRRKLKDKKLNKVSGGGTLADLKDEVLPEAVEAAELANLADKSKLADNLADKLADDLANKLADDLADDLARPSTNGLANKGRRFGLAKKTKK